MSYTSFNEQGGVMGEVVGKVRTCCLVLLMCFFSVQSLAATDNTAEVINAHIFNTLKPKDERIFEIYKKSIIEIETPRVVPESSPEFKIYGTKEIISAFNKNEIKATNKFIGKKIRVKGVAIEIGLNALDNGFVRAGSEFSYVIMAIDKKDPAMQNIVAGDNIEMVCIVDKYNFHIVYLDGCITAKAVSKAMAERDFQGVKYEAPERYPSAMAAIIFKINEDFFNKKCNKAGEACKKAIYKKLFLTDKEKKKARESVVSFLNENNIHEWLENLPERRTQ